jgi:hypothetical protein
MRMDPSVQPFDIEQLWDRIEEAAPLGMNDTRESTEFIDPAESEHVYAQTARRRSFIAFFSWAVPSRDAIDAIAEFVAGRHLLEVCAGSGLWARLIAANGTSVIATDASPVKETYYPVAAEEAEQAVRAHPDCLALFLCWPPFRNDCAARALTAFRGDRLIFVGDARFAADQQFHELLRQQWLLQQTIPIAAWPGLDDHVYLYERK